MNNAVVPRTESLPAPRITLGAIQAHTGPELIEQAAILATALKAMIDKQKLSKNLGNRNYVMVEGWTTLATLMGCMPREDQVTRDPDGTYTAVVSLVRMNDNHVISTGSAECGMDEPKWSKGPRYARRSMAVTRATGKACRLAFSWVMSMAGYEVTPFEEMDAFQGQHPDEHPAAPKSAPTEQQSLPTSPPPPPPPQNSSGVRLASNKQVNLISMRLDRAGLDYGEIYSRFSVESIEEIAAKDVDAVLKVVAGLIDGSIPLMSKPESTATTHGDKGYDLDDSDDLIPR